MEVSGFVFRRSYYEALLDMDEESRRSAIDAVLKYVFEGVLPENLPPMASIWFKMARPNIDSSTSKYAACLSNGKKGGRPRKNQSEKPNVKTKGKNLDKDKDKDMDTLPLTGGKVIQSEEYDF